MNVVKAAAIQQLSARIDGRRKRVREIVTGSINAAHSRAFLQTTILCSPTAEDVKVFEGKTHRIKTRMTARARFILRMQCQQFPDRSRTANVRLDRRNAGRRRRWWLPNEPLHDPCSPNNRRGRCTVGRDFQDRPLRQQSAVWATDWYGNLAHRRTADRRQLIVLCQAIIGKDKIGVDQHPDRQVFAYHRGEECFRLTLHRFNKIGVKAVLRVKSRVRLIPMHMPQIEPIVYEILHEAIEFRT